MNLLPYVLCRRNKWQFSDESISEVARHNLNKHWALLNNLCDEFFSAPYDLDYLLNDVDSEAGVRELEDIQAGLIHLAPELFYQMINDFEDSELPYNGVDVFVRGMELTKPKKVLMFPDDNSENLYLSAFFPIRAEVNELLLNHSRMLIIPDNAIPFEELQAYKNGCTLMAKRTYPGRIFSCKNIACASYCTERKGIERARVTTIKCECC